MEFSTKKGKRIDRYRIQISDISSPRLIYPAVLYSGATQYSGFMLFRWLFIGYAKKIYSDRKEFEITWRKGVKHNNNYYPEQKD